MRSPLWPASVTLVAAGAALVRWLVQGSGNVYTATARRFYVPDPDLGWRVAAGGPLWLGLEAIAVIGAVAAAVAVAGLLLRRLERTRARPLRGARAGLWLVAALPLIVPAWAFATGLGPRGGREALPAGATAAAPTGGIEGALPLPAGRYEVVPHAGTAVTAKLAAGKERFEARFARGVTGWWTVDGADLRRPTTAEISVDAAAVDTGIALRSQHARDEYLRVAAFPAIRLRLGKLVAARQDGPALVAFRSEASLDFLGETLAVEVTGQLRAADADAKARLGFAAGDDVALVAAELAVTVAGTRLRSDQDSFDADLIPIHVALVLIRRA